ncbi:unnamed protein product [Cuscuta epithymum]|uniref:F-box domain-containing protein n=1 Tax=Cuscuta epithymum TaxID=186058 RepID=A0AAV0ETK2_9ASTE|nr:unnamed protein product [Cuscuta epithymum]
MAAKDRISELPGDVIDHILGFLPIRDAARTSALSTVWRDVWLSVSQLRFDRKFFDYIQYNYVMASAMFIINKILMKHNGPIRKFVFDFTMFYLKDDEDKSRWAEFDELLLFLTRNGVEEMDLSFESSAYILPDFIYSCSTLKKLSLCGVFIEPIKASCIFPNVTSLYLEDVECDSKNLVQCPADLPMLKSLVCRNISGFNITAPKLSCLTICFTLRQGILPVNMDMKTIHSLHLDDYSTKDFIKELTRLGKQGTTLNVNHLKLGVDVKDDEISAFIDLLRMCPKLYRLDILLPWDVEATTIDFLLEHPKFNVAETCKTVHELHLFCMFSGSRGEMLLFKWLLTCFPMLKKLFVFQRTVFSSQTENRKKRKLLRFLRGSSKANIVYIIGRR